MKIIEENPTNDGIKYIIDSTSISIIIKTIINTKPITNTDRPTSRYVSTLLVMLNLIKDPLTNNIRIVETVYRKTSLFVEFDEKSIISTIFTYPENNKKRAEETVTIRVNI